MPVFKSPVTISVANIVTSVTGMPEGVNLLLNDFEAMFIKENAPATLALNVTVGELPEFGSDTLIFDAGSTWELHHDGDNTALVVTLRGRERVVRFNSDRSAGELICRPEMLHEVEGQMAIEALAHPVHELTTYWQLTETGGLGVHSCGIVHEGWGYLFSGWSGAGKSTIGSLWLDEGAIMLNDDRIGVWPQDDGSVRIFGTPWHGSVARAHAQSAPLRGIFFIEHAPENQLIPLQGVQAVAQLLAFTFFPMFDAKMIEKAAETAQYIMDRVPCYRLRFLPDSSAVEFILDSLM